MATSTVVRKADSPTLKRAFTPDLVPNTFLPSKKCEREFAHQSIRPCYSRHSPSRPSNRRSCSPRSGQRPVSTRRPSMVQASSRTFASPMSTFMSVFGEEPTSTGTNRLSGHHDTSLHTGTIARPSSSGNIPSGSTSSNTTFSAFHVHRDSTSTLASEASDSSPTTTISTMDSSSVTDPSPGPSPESPLAKTAAPSFVADLRSRRTDNGSSESSPTTFFELQRPTTPAKKPRNLKNLGINTSTSLSNLRSNPTASLPGLFNKENKNSSAPVSPSFIKPPTPPKRRPSNLSLTIQTPGSDNKPVRLVIPSTPAVNHPALRHFQSSPSLPLCSPIALLSGGTRQPVLRPLKTNPHGFAEVPFEHEEEDQEQNFDIPQSREEKPAAYPNGPICIYESGVYLYFEPTAEQAATFDVIFNVASEVQNPYTSPEAVSQKELDARRIDGPPPENVDFAALLERKAASLDTEGGSPTTPKATPVLETVLPSEKVVNGSHLKIPEYIHMPWEHNTDIVPDLYNLVKIMDDRVKQGKRVLVHCQCGVSRSASLIVAYGIYKNPGISVQEAYDAAKKRSKWIGPNMNLIMQLQEFRNGLLRANESRTHNQSYGFPRRSAGLSTGVSTGTNRHSPFDREVPSGPRTPRTAPLPPDSDITMQRASTGNMMSISPGPLSAPSSTFFSPDFRRSWASPSSQTHFDLSPRLSPTATPYVDTQGHLVPVLSVTENDAPAVFSAMTVPHIYGNNTESEQSVDASKSHVPNFSRQLPFRRLLDNESTDSASHTKPIDSEAFLLAPSQPSHFDRLRSPITTSFIIPPLAPINPTAQMKFNVNTWSRSQDTESYLPPSLGESQRDEPPMSPTSSGFHTMSFGAFDASDELVSPRATTFDLGPVFGNSSEFKGRSSQNFEVSSPTVTEFPKYTFARTDDAFGRELRSPRSTEFHMAPLIPKVAGDDPFDLTSPKRFEIPSTSFEKMDFTLSSEMEMGNRRPSFQAILPPSHLEQPEATNGFASLNSTAQAQFIASTTPFAEDEAPTTSDVLSNSKGPSMSSELRTTPPAEATLPQTTIKPGGAISSTPQKPNGIRTRFSTPNLREQRKLHKIQTAMESLLPNRSPQPPQTVDDLDALLSPRAEEFTRNPFHFDLQSLTDDTSPASSNETIKEGHSHIDWKEHYQITPQKVVEDPRSPVQTGGSPIVRNIWDVL